MTRKFQWISLILFSLLGIASAWMGLRLQFSFNFEQFFPKGDPDLAFFQEFIEDFETDDNFLLLAVERKEGVFDSAFLNQFHELTLAARELPHVQAVESLTRMRYPVKTPFGITTIPAIHLDEPGKLASDREKILADPRFVYNLIDEKGTALVIFMKTVEAIDLDQSKELIVAVEKLAASRGFADFYLLGRPYFQKEIVEMQQRELVVSMGAAAVLVTLILIGIFRRFWGIFVALLSLGMGMLLFIGFLGATGRPLSVMSALYPVLMIIVGTSDVIHIMIKYTDELKKGLTRRDAIRVTIREVGLATFLTSATTAVGFATLLSSRIQPIREFGVNSAIGVMLAYLTVILFTTALLSLFRREQITYLGYESKFWEPLLHWWNRFTQSRARSIGLGTLIFVAFCVIGISQITTNYTLRENMPRGAKITQDFIFFEDKFAGFRPLEVAVIAQNGRKADDFEVVQEIDKVEKFMLDEPAIRAVVSIAMVYKSLHQMQSSEGYTMPASEEVFARYKRQVDKLPQSQQIQVLVSEDGDKARITSRLLDVGVDSIKAIGRKMDAFLAAEVDTSIATFQRTGTGLIVDKNAEFVRNSLLQGLGAAILVISLIMGIVFRDARMMVVFLIPNILPLLLAGAFLGYAGIELEAGISVIFSIVFGIAVDDTIHFLSRYNLLRRNGADVESAIQTTFQETGKAMILTSVILFFGFLVMLFSIHPPSVIVGVLISLTLVSALVFDMTLIPILIRWFNRSTPKPDPDNRP